MIPVIVERTGIAPEKRVHDLTKGERRTLLETIKRFDIPIAGTRPVSEAIVTSGGIKVSEINPSTMGSKKCSGLYFAGEVLDVDHLKVSPALAYNRKQYSVAYQIYQTIVSKYPEEGDPYYRMAVMLYQKDYGRSMNKRTRQKLILDYLDKAIHHGSYSTSHCADNMRYWLTC